MNFENFVNGKIYEIFNFIYKMMVINLLWLITVFLGLGIFSFMPATVALNLLIKAVIQNEDVPLFKTFYKIFFKEYYKSQKIFLFFLFLGLILYFNFSFYLNSKTNTSQFALVICYLITFIYLLVFTNIFLVYIYYPHVKVFRTLKLALLISMLYALKTLLVILINVILIYICFSVKILFALAPLFLMSLISYITISLLINNYNKLVKEHEILTVKKYL